MRWAIGAGAAVIIGYFIMRSKSIDILARTIWGEARGEGFNGMLAVAHVINNRASLGGWWGATIVDVALKPWQFSAWNKNDPNRDKILTVTNDNEDFRSAKAIATAVIDGEIADPTGGATHYHATSVLPDWADPAKIITRIGNHIFYKGIK